MKPRWPLLAGAAVVALALLAWWLGEERAPDVADAPTAEPAAATPGDALTTTKPDEAPDLGATAAPTGSEVRAAVDPVAAETDGVVVRLVDAQGAPVPHARVGYLPDEREADPGGRNVALEFAGYDDQELPLFFGDLHTAGADGRLVVPTPRRRASIAARSDQHFGRARIGARDAEVLVRMHAAPLLRVRVVDASGAPVEGAPIALSVHRSGPLEEGRAPGPWEPAGVTDSGGWGVVSAVRSSRLPDGGSAWVGVGGAFEDLHAAICIADGVPVRPPAEIRLPELVPLRLRVTEADGTPVRGATTGVRSAEAERGPGHARPSFRTPPTGAGGRAVVSPVEAGIAVHLSAAHPAGGREVARTRTSSREEVTLALRGDDLVVVLSLADEDGVGLGDRAADERELGFHTEATWDDGETRIQWVRAVRRADERLEFRFSGRSAGRLERLVLHALADDPWATAEVEVPLPTRPATLDPVDLGTVTLAGEDQLVAGRVVDAGGLPVRRARLGAVRPGAGPDRTSTDLERWMSDRSLSPERFPYDRSSREGEFELVGRAPAAGTVDVLATGSGRLSPLRVRDVPVGTTDLVVTLRPQVTVCGQLVGDPVLIDMLGGPSHVQLVRDDGVRYPASGYFVGAFEFEETRGPAGPEYGVEVGTYRLVLGPPELPPVAIVEGIVLERPRSGHEVDLGEVRVDGLAEFVTLRAVDTDGEPVPSAIAAGSAVGDSPTWWSADAEGAIHLPRVPGGLDLKVGAFGYPPREVLGVGEDREVVLAQGPEIVLHWPDMPALPEGAHVDPAIAAEGANRGYPSHMAGVSFDANGEARFRASFFGEAVSSFYAWGPDDAWIGTSFSLSRQSEEGFVRIVIPDDPGGSRITVQWPRSVVDALAEHLR